MTEKEEINERVRTLRAYMREKGLQAFIFPSTDPHCGEYVPEHWMTRQWISGFDGSAGTAVVTLEDAALWTDSRYFIAAADQLAGTPFRLMKDGLEETPSITEWIDRTIKSSKFKVQSSETSITPQKGDTEGAVAIDGWVNTMEDVRGLKAELQKANLQLCIVDDPADELWKNRPDIPTNPIEIHPLEYAGETCQSKITRLREALQQAGAEGTVVSQLDEIAWLLNLRGTDVHCNPVFVAYLLIEKDKVTLLTNPEKITPEVATYLKENNIYTLPYADITDALKAFKAETLLLDPNTSNWNLQAYLPETCKIVEHKSLIASMKAIKNEAEIRGFRNAMVRDGVAMVKFLRWLKQTMTDCQLSPVNCQLPTEMDVDRKLTSLRAEQPLFRDISFDTIAAYGPHGAIVHYEPTPETDIRLEPKGLLLLDSGAQYQDGTTDITRTIALGPLTESEKLDYTLVLKGHIRLALTKFPKGACGTQIDALARYAMWQHGINFLHGTGHGVGSYLNVHEGPHQIRMNYKPAPLLPGMTVTNEPGIYRAGKHGVRIENTMIVKEYKKTEFGEFLQLEPLTLCPIDTTPIIWEMMLPDEIAYLNAYHKRVCEELSPYLSEEERKSLPKGEGNSLTTNR
ncbi:MAG: aminopeptidase P family protein [Bacteroidaceae bacterium]|nr:aminopeptidase P family protein [Bacteroidaceae bacterium]